MNQNKLQPETGYVYFIADFKSNAVKIGYTADERCLRRKQLQTGNPNPLYLLKSIPGTKYIESLYQKALHKYITDSKGEWFRLVDEVIQFCQLTEALENINSTLLSTSDIGTETSSQYLLNTYSSNIDIDDVYKYM